MSIYEIKTKYYNLKHFFLNCWKYRNSLSEARAWDWQGGLNLLRDHLIQMEKLQRSDKSHGLHAKKYADQIKVAILLIDRINNDNTQHEWWDFSFDKWGEGLEKTENGMLRITSLTRNAWTKKSPCVPNPRNNKSWKLHVNVEKYHYEYLMKYLTKHMKTWWD
jgi:hypothetical protein